MPELLRSFKLMCAVLLVPVVPFLAFGSQMSQWVQRVERWDESGSALPATAAVIVGLLATDIFLPIPSSVVSTMGGWKLGVWGGTMASWVGMSVGAIFGFALARRWGRPFALWFCRQEDLGRMQELSHRFGPWVLVITRSVPVVAEASVLLTGIHHLSWHRFLPPVLLCNVGIALAYSAFGHIAQTQHWLPLALGVSIALPVLLAMLAKRWLSS